MISLKYFIDFINEQEITIERDVYVEVSELDDDYKQIEFFDKGVLIGSCTLIPNIVMVKNLKNQLDYYQMEVIFIKKEFRGQGYLFKMVREILDYVTYKTDYIGLMFPEAYQTPVMTKAFKKVGGYITYKDMENNDVFVITKKTFLNNRVYSLRD